MKNIFCYNFFEEIHELNWVVEAIISAILRCVNEEKNLMQTEYIACHV